MIRFGLIYVLTIGLGLSLNAQPPINQWYSFGKPQSLLNSVVSTDSCYYASGIIASDITPGIADFVFTKIDLNGDVVLEKFLHSDTNWIHNGSADLITTYDTNFVTILDYDKYFMFAKFNPQGDTICTGIIKEFYDLHGHESVQCTAVIENIEDSSYTSLVCIQNETDLGSYIGLVNTNAQGDVNFYQFYPINLSGYMLTYPRSLIKTTDGYLISCDIIKYGGGTPMNDSQRVRLIKVDENGNEEWRWTDMANANDLFPFGLTATPDGGYLYGGQSGWYYAPLNGHFFNAQIVKLNNDLSLDWEITMPDSAGEYYTVFTDIISVPDSKYVATGFTAKDSMTVGWLINFNLEGEVIWDSYFSFVPANVPDLPEHELYDIAITPDHGFAMVGKAWDVEATNVGIPGSFGWLVKTDSVGCLVPGCQDFLSLDENQQAELKLSMYPNPANNILNIYFNDPSFSGKALMQVYDVHGNLVKEWPLQNNDITYLYDVSALISGIYLLKVMDNGIEKGSAKFVKQ